MSHTLKKRLIPRGTFFRESPWGLTEVVATYTRCVPRK